MTIRRALASCSFGKRTENSKFSKPEFENPSKLLMLSYQKKPRFVLDYVKVGLGIISSIYEQTQPICPSRIVFGCRVETLISPKPAILGLDFLRKVVLYGADEYRLVLSHPPFPRIVHFFVLCCLARNPCKFLDFLDEQSSISSFHVQFLKHCFTCKWKLRDGRNIYIFKGDQSFCSNECRFVKILLAGPEEHEVRTRALSPPRRNPRSSKKRVVFYIGGVPHSAKE